MSIASKTLRQMNKEIEELRLVNENHKYINGKLRVHLTKIKEYCKDEIDEEINVTDNTEDICEGRKEFARGLLLFIENIQAIDNKKKGGKPDV